MQKDLRLAPHLVLGLLIALLSSGCTSGGVQEPAGTAEQKPVAGNTSTPASDTKEGSSPTATDAGRESTISDLLVGKEEDPAINALCESLPIMQEFGRIAKLDEIAIDSTFASLAKGKTGPIDTYACMASSGGKTIWKITVSLDSFGQEQCELINRGTPNPEDLEVYDPQGPGFYYEGQPFLGDFGKGLYQATYSACLDGGLIFVKVINDRGHDPSDQVSWETLQSLVLSAATEPRTREVVDLHSSMNGKG